MKASDIRDQDMLAAVAHEMTGIGASAYKISLRFPEFPEKVVRAKLHALLRRKLIHGCCCGCRGDFTLTEKGETLRTLA